MDGIIIVVIIIVVVVVVGEKDNLKNKNG